MGGEPCAHGFGVGDPLVRHVFADFGRVAPWVERCLVAAAEYGDPGNYVTGANLAGYTKVADAMVALGLI